MGMRRETVIPVDDDRTDDQKEEHQIDEGSVPDSGPDMEGDLEPADSQPEDSQPEDIQDEAIPFPEDEDDTDPFQKEMMGDPQEKKPEEKKDTPETAQAEPPESERNLDETPLEGQAPEQKTPEQVALEQQAEQQAAVQLPEGFDEALTPLYQANPERAQQVHQTLHEHKELLGLGVPIDGLKTFARRNKEVIERVNLADQLEGEVVKAREFARVGNMDKVAEVLGLDPAQLERYYNEKREAQELGTENEFRARYAQSEEQVQLAMENLELRKQAASRQQQENYSQAQYWNGRISQDPDMAAVNQKMGDQTYVQRQLEKNFAALPEGQRSIENAFLRTAEEMKLINSKMAGTPIQAPIQAPGPQTPQAPVPPAQPPVQAPAPQAPAVQEPPQRPAGLNPPSSNVPQRSTVSGRRQPRNIEEWALSN